MVSESLSIDSSHFIIDLAVGQGIYFAAQSATSLSYTQPDADNNRHMFMGKIHQNQR